ncbi:MAG: methyltransferase domain-containing protein [archaeon]
MNKIIIFSPHCDDSILSLGGSIREGILGKDIEVHTVFSISNYTILGRNFENIVKTTKIRNEEERKVMNLLKIKNYLWGYKEFPIRRKLKNKKNIFSKKLEYSIEKLLIKELKKRIEHIIAKNKKAIFLFPLSLGHHKDHIIITSIGLSFLRKIDKIFFYEDQPYAGEYSLKKIKSHATKLNKGLKPTLLPVNNLSKKIRILKKYKSQLDAEDVFYSYFHTQRRKGEVIWGIEGNSYLNKIEESLKETQEFFKRGWREELIADFLKLNKIQIKEKMIEATKNLAKEWFHSKKEKNKFYQTTENYILELENWHINDKSKQAGIIVIASQSKNKRILEYGCGTADTSLLSLKFGAKECHALDLRSKTLDFGRFKAIKIFGKIPSKLKFIETPESLKKLKLKRNYYDIVSCEDFFEHVDYPEEHAKKIYSSLKEGGSLFFSTEFIHSDFHPMHLKRNEKYNGVSWFYILENMGFEIVSPCQAIKRE